MKNFLLLPAICLISLSAAAQTGTPPPPPPSVFNFVEQMPRYPTDIPQYLAANIKYPEDALKNNIQGRVIARFVVTDSGTVRDVTIIRGIGAGCDEEVVRVVSAMGKWSPGIQNGKPVDVYFNLPVNFTIDAKDTKK